MIDVVLLGTGGMMPLPNRWLSCLLVRAEGDVTLFDCGEGTQIAWRASGWSFKRLGAICLSHTHADHVAGLPGLLHAVANADRTEPIGVYGPPGIASVVAGLREIAPVLPYAVHIHELETGAEFILPGGLRARCASGEHGLPVLAYRVEQRRNPAFLAEEARALGIPVNLWQRLQAGESVSWQGRTIEPGQVLGPPRRGLSIGYVTDTRPLPELVELVAEVDLLVCEGTYGDDADHEKAVRNAHMTYREAATLARDSGAKQLWITHFSPAMDEPERYLPYAASVFANSVIGVDGLSASLSFPDSG